MKVTLNDSLLINSGTNRACYLHPDNIDRCVKIDISLNTKETKREKRYYNYLLKRNIPFDMISKYYGSIQTNLGNGEVVELLRDYDGNVSMELAQYLNSTLTESDMEYIKKLIRKLKEYLYRYKIYVKDLNSVNIVVQKFAKSGNARLVIVDGLAHSWYVFVLGCISDAFLMTNIEQSWKNFISTTMIQER